MICCPPHTQHFLVIQQKVYYVLQNWFIYTFHANIIPRNLFLKIFAFYCIWIRFMSYFLSFHKFVSQYVYEMVISPWHTTLLTRRYYFIFKVKTISCHLLSIGWRRHFNYNVEDDTRHYRKFFTVFSLKRL